ncbi:hypothetical protein Tco_1353573 [Tanacetum coccineum]
MSSMNTMTNLPSQILAFSRVLDDMKASRLALLHELSLLGTQLVVAVVIDKSSGNTSVISCATDVTILLPLWTQDPPFSSSLKDSPDARFKPSEEEEKKDAEDPGKDKDNVIDENIVYGCADDPNIPELEDIVYSDDDEDVGAEADMNNLDVYMPVSPILTSRIHKDHPVEQIIEDLNSAPQTRRMKKNLKEHEEPKTVVQALKDPSWIKAMQEEHLQFKLQEVWIPNGKQAIGTKWVFRNKKDERELKQLGYS